MLIERGKRDGYRPNRKAVDSEYELVLTKKGRKIGNSFRAATSREPTTQQRIVSPNASDAPKKEMPSPTMATKEI